MSAIEIVGVSKNYGAVTVLDSIDLAVGDGTKTVIVGSSGSGKTTLLRLLSGFEFPRSGTIRVGSKIVAAPDVAIAAHRREIGYVAQDGALFPHLTVAENVAFGLHRMSGDARRSRVQELLELVSLDVSLSSRRPDQLSGGQQQRVALARALARKPKVMLLDEPFSALDFALRAVTRDLVSTALTAAGITTVLVTHDRAEALAFGDQLAVLRDGCLVQVGSPREVYSRPTDVVTARFLGDAVTLRATVDDTGAHTALGLVSVAAASAHGVGIVMFRPEQLTVRGEHDGVGRVTAAEFHGPEVLLTVQMHSSDESVRVPAPVTAGILIGDRVSITPSGAALVFAAS